MPNKSIYIGVDSTNKSDENGRRSLYLYSKKYYNHGLFIFDLAHMPANVCGTWPLLYFAHWTGNVGNGGELHVTDGNLLSFYSILLT
jgi:hypothetical protein